MTPGHFAGEVLLRFDPKKHPNEAVLWSSVAYHDAGGHVWFAPAGSPVDGASIPRIFRWLIGGPFSGHYVRAGVVHDVACQDRVKTGLPSWAAHYMFWEAMRTDGTNRVLAWVMWASVRLFGPRWK